MSASISIERLKHSTRIHRSDDFDFGPFGAFAEVQDVEFDGYVYTVTALMIDPDYGYATDHEVQFVVDAGQTVDFGGIGEPALRAEADVSDEEWEAKGEAIGAAIDRVQGRLNDALGHECVAVDESLLLGSVADALGVDMQMAAE